MIILRGWAAWAAIVVGAVFGVLTVLATTADMLIAQWKIAAPALLVYGAVIWRWGLAPADRTAEAPPASPAEAIAETVAKLAATIAIILASLGLVAAGIYALQVAGANWAYVVLAVALLAAVFGWAWIGEVLRERRAWVMVGEDPREAQRRERAEAQARIDARPTPRGVQLALRWTRIALAGLTGLGVAVTVLDEITTHAARPWVTVPTFCAFFALLFASLSGERPMRRTVLGVLANLGIRFVMSCVVIGMIVLAAALVMGLAPLAARYWYVSAPAGAVLLALLVVVLWPTRAAKTQAESGPADAVK